MLYIDKVTKYYATRHGLRCILRDVTFSLRKGQKLGILGCNGAGKSTLIRLIGGVELPTSGTVRSEMSISWPLAFQGGFVGGLTGIDNLRFICRVYGISFEKALPSVASFSELGSYLYEPVINYSSGMRARLAFAISMAVDFDCYLMDEISAVGDRRFNAKCKQELFNLKGARSIVMVSHFYSVINEYCDTIAVLDNGTFTMFDDKKDATKYYDAVLARKDISF